MLSGAREEVSEQPVPGSRENRLRVELHAFYIQVPVSQTHDRAVVGLGSDLEDVWQALSLDHERVISRCLQRVRQACEHSSGVVANERRLAVHDLGRPHDLAAVDLTYALMTEADTQDGYSARETADEVVRDSR